MPSLNFSLIDKDLQGIISNYQAMIEGIHQAGSARGGRAFGGVARAAKGTFVEKATEDLVRASWKALGRADDRLSFNPVARKSHLIEIQDSYIESVKDGEIKAFLQNAKREGKGYNIKPDVPVLIDGQFVLSIECKAYTENAMLKRIIMDCYFLRHLFPNLKFSLLMLESHLGGDYSALPEKAKGSPSTHAIMSHFPDIKIDFIVLLKGERNVGKPIHDARYAKPLEVENLKKAVSVIVGLLADK